MTRTASGASATTVTLSIANHSDEWYYQYTTPIGGTCSGGLSADTVAATATGLSFNTAYTFAAYSGSSCASSAEITSVTLKTPQ